MSVVSRNDHTRSSSSGTAYSQSNSSSSTELGEDVFEVEKIVKKRRHPTKGVLYFVKWRHFPNSANTWEPACNFPEELISNFEASHKSNGKKQKPSSSSTQLAVFNQVTSDHPLPIVEEIVYEPELTKEPIIITDVTAQDLTVTISECKTPEGFFIK